MKKHLTLIVILSFSFFSLSACSNSNQQESQIGHQLSSTDEKQTESTSISSDIEDNLNQSSSTSNSGITSSSSITDTDLPLVKERNLPDSLLPYSDSQIEYARVWLAVMGDDYVNNLDDPDFLFNLNVDLIPAGSLINIYATGTPTYPVDVISLSGDASFQGSVIYSSNYDGTVTVYPTPMHWHYSEEQSKDPAFLTEASQWVLDNQTIVTVPASKPESVKRLIDTLIIKF